MRFFQNNCIKNWLLYIPVAFVLLFSALTFAQSDIIETDVPALKDVFAKDFYIGCLLSYPHVGFASDPYVPSTYIVAPNGGYLIKYHMNSMSPGNNMKPQYTVDISASAAAYAAASSTHQDSVNTHPVIGFNGNLIAQLNWAQRQGFTFRGHTLVWHNQTPSEFFCTGYASGGVRLSKDQMIERMDNYIKEVIRLIHENWPGLVTAIDVVNEAVSDGGSDRIDSEWYKTFSDNSYLMKAFELTRKWTVYYGETQVKLYYNDYNAHIAAKADGIVRICTPIFEAGYLDGIGMQDHDQYNSPTAEQWIASYNKFDPICTEMSVTELDVKPSTNTSTRWTTQANQYAALVKCFVERSYFSGRGKIISVSKDGLNDQYAFVANASLWDTNNKCKPAFYAVVDVGNNYNALDSLISYADTLSAGDFTPESWAVFTAALTAAENAMGQNYSQSVSAANSLGVARVNLITALDGLENTGQLDVKKPIIVEAESGELGSDFTTVEDGEITFVRILTDGADFSPAIWDYPGLSRRVISYKITFPAGGTYNLFARVRVGSGAETPQNNDSFFYATGFGIKDTIAADDWVVANGLYVAGFSDFSHFVDGPGGLGARTWKWVNLSKNSYHEAATTLTVEGENLTVTFQIGGREDGLDIDRLAFGRADLYYTVGNLENGEPGSEELPGEVYEGPPLAMGKPKFLGCAYSNSQASNFDAYWNQVTPENAGKWVSVEGIRDVMNWGGLDAAYNFAKNNGFPFRFHVLIWGNQQPVWIENLANSPDEQLAEIREWFAAVAERYPAIDYLEVVNEPLHDPPAGATNGNYIEALGGTGETGWDWVLNAFRMAREIFPATTKLLINEYGVINSASNVNRYLEIIGLLQAENLIDGIGIQGHAFSTRGSAEDMIENLNSLATAGLPLQITEMDIDGPTDATQLADYQRIFPVVWEHPAVIGVTLWGWRPGLWRNTEKAYIVELSGVERPALEWLREYVPSTTIWVSVENPVVEVPQAFYLSDNYPNPFNPTTRIEYSLPEDAYISLKVYNLLGKEVATLFAGVQIAGHYTVPFNGNELAAGVYLYQLRAENFIETKRFVLMK